jgi:urease accessory protein
MLRLTQILGNAAEPALAERLHGLGHDGVVEYITLDAADTARKRLRVSTDRGTDCAVAIPRSEHLANGSILLLEETRAVVVRMRETIWLALAPRDLAAALELGYFCGNLHWRVRFEDAVIKVALDGPRETYMARLTEHLADGRARLIEDREQG